MPDELFNYYMFYQLINIKSISNALYQLKKAIASQIDL